MQTRVRRALVVALALVGLWAACGPIRATPQAPAAVSGVAAIGITVADAERSVAFYRDVLGFEPDDDRRVAGETRDRLHGIEGGERRVVGLQLGDERIELVQWLTPRGRPVPDDSRSNDRWFQHIAIIVNDMDQAYLWLMRHGVSGISLSPQRLPDSNPAAGGIRAFYFKDPDGHALELLEFPPDKGSARWRQPSNRVFLGIDHTAITVGDTETSLRFYRDTLGLRVAGESLNFGIEQERLNNVAGARVRITSLRADTGPAIEFLEYLHPRDGRPLRPDARSNDLTHWQTIMTGDAARIAPLISQTATLISRGVISTPATHGFTRAIAFRDPDGHALELRSR